MLRRFFSFLLLCAVLSSPAPLFAKKKSSLGKSLQDIGKKYQEHAERPSVRYRKLWAFNVQYSQPLNLNTDKDFPALIPVFIYKNDRLGGSPFRVFSLLTGIHNSALFAYSLKELGAEESLSVFAEGNTLLHFGGDQPSQNGQDLSQFSFHGHRLGLLAGGSYDFPIYEIPFRFSLQYDYLYQISYDPEDPSQLTLPNNFHEHGPKLQLHFQYLPPSELFEFGILPNSLLMFKFREGINAWGSVGNLRRVESYAAFSLGNAFALPVYKNKIFATGHFNFGIQSAADRLNTFLIGSSFFLGNSLRYFSVPGMNLGEARVDRVLTADFGPRFYPMGHYFFAIKPFVFGASYREVRVQGLKNNTVGGAGLKLMGYMNKRFLWALGYAAAWGVDRASDPAHEIYLTLGFELVKTMYEKQARKDL